MVGEWYTKEIEVSSKRGLLISVLFIFILLAIATVPPHYAVTTYTHTSYYSVNTGYATLNNTTVQVTGNMKFNDTSHMIYSIYPLTQHSGTATIHNISLKNNYTMTAHFKPIHIIGGELFITFYNESYSAIVMKIHIVLDGFGNDSVVELYVNNMAIGSKHIDLAKYSMNPTIALTMHDNGNYTFAVGNSTTFKIYGTPIIHGSYIGLANITDMQISGNWLYNLGMYNISYSTTKTHTTTIPFVKNKVTASLLIIVALALIIAVFFLKEWAVELSLMSVLLLAIIIPMSYNLTIFWSYVVVVSLALISVAVVIYFVDFKPVEELDLFLEKHLWKILIIWFVLVFFAMKVMG